MKGGESVIEKSKKERDKIKLMKENQPFPSFLRKWEKVKWQSEDILA